MGSQPGFDPYHRWLGIGPDEDRNFYRLLALRLYEADTDVIDRAVDRQMIYIRACATGQYAREAQLLLNELEQARNCLLNPQRKAQYDAELRARGVGGSGSHARGSDIHGVSAPQPPAAIPIDAPPVAGAPPARQRGDGDSALAGSSSIHSQPPGGAPPIRRPGESSGIGGSHVLGGAPSGIGGASSSVIGRRAPPAGRSSIHSERPSGEPPSGLGGSSGSMSAVRRGGSSSKLRGKSSNPQLPMMLGIAGVGGGMAVVVVAIGLLAAFAGGRDTEDPVEPPPVAGAGETELPGGGFEEPPPSTPNAKTPLIEGVADLNLSAGSILRLAPTAREPDGSIALSYRWRLEKGPPGVRVEPSTGRVLWKTGTRHIGTHSVTVAVQNPTTRQVGSKTIEVRVVASQGELNLASLADLEADAASGIWTRDAQSGALECAAQGRSLLEFPFVPEGPYRLRVTAERRSNNGHLLLGLVTGGKACQLFFDAAADQAHATGLEAIDGRLSFENGSGILGRCFPDTAPVTLEVVVADDTIHVTRDGRFWYRWRGNFQRLGVNPGMIAPNGALWIGAWESGFRFREVQLSLLPASSGPPSDDGSGLLAEVYSGRNFETLLRRRIDRQIAFDWLSGRLDPEASSADNISIRWTGYITVPQPGGYQLFTHTDDGDRVTVGGERVIDQWTTGTPAWRQASKPLAAGRHPLVVEYFEAAGNARCELHWQPPDGARTRVPPEALTHDVSSGSEELRERLNDLLVAERLRARALALPLREAYLAAPGEEGAAQLEAALRQAYTAAGEEPAGLESAARRKALLLEWWEALRACDILEGRESLRSEISAASVRIDGEELRLFTWEEAVSFVGASEGAVVAVPEEELKIQDIALRRLLQADFAAFEKNRAPDSARKLLATLDGHLARIAGEPPSSATAAALKALHLARLSISLEIDDFPEAERYLGGLREVTADNGSAHGRLFPEAELAALGARVRERLLAPAPGSVASAVKLLEEWAGRGEVVSGDELEQFARTAVQYAQEGALNYRAALAALEVLERLGMPRERALLEKARALNSAFDEPAEQNAPGAASTAQTLAREWLELSSQFLEIGSVKEARAAVQVAQRSVRKAIVPSNRARFDQDAARQLEEIKARESIELARERLGADPRHAEAPADRRLVGEWELARRNYDSAWSLLAESDSPLAQLAAKCGALPEGGRPLKQVADEVHQRAGEIPRSDPLNLALLAWAASLYRDSLDAEQEPLAGLERSAVASVLSQLDNVPAVTRNVAGREAAEHFAMKLNESVDLLRLANPRRDTVAGSWAKRGTELFVPGEADHERLMLPVTVRGGYELNVEFTRTVGEDAVGLFLPVGHQLARLSLSWGGGSCHGLEWINRVDANGNPKAVRPGSLSNGRRYRLRAAVRPLGANWGVAAWLDDQPIIDEQVSAHEIGLMHQSDMPRFDCPGLHASRCAVTFHEANFKLLGGEATYLGPEEPNYPPRPYTLMNTYGRKDQFRFLEAAGDPAARLAGFAIDKSHDRILGIQPIYRYRGRDIPGGVYSGPASHVVVVAKPGYAVGGLQMRTDGGGVRAMTIVFMRERGELLDPGDMYMSPLYGGGGVGTAGPILLTDGSPVIGVHGTYHNEIFSLGLVLADTPRVEPNEKLKAPALPADPALLITFEPATVSEENGARTVRDPSNPLRHGTLVGGKLVPGLAGQALLLDGDSYLKIADAEAFKGGSAAQLTVAAWMRCAPGAWHGVVLGKAWDQNAMDWRLIGRENLLKFESRRSGKAINLEAHWGLGDGWRHVAFVVDRPAGTLRIYGDGRLAAEETRLDDVLDEQKDPLYIGRHFLERPQHVGGACRGMIDEVAIYRRALTAAEIQALFQRGAAGDPLR